jgi:two-component system cell cycle sensor histidine kinase/response regulator CckA
VNGRRARTKRPSPTSEDRLKAVLDSGVGEALRASEEKYRTLVDLLPAVTYRCAFGEHGEWLYVSPQIESLLGYSPAEWTANPALWYSLLHAEDRERAMTEEARIRDSGERYVMEYRLQARNGRIVWVHDEAWPIRDETGRPAFLQGVLLDITERKRAEQTALESERRYRMLVDSIEGLVWEADPHTLQFTFVSRQAERLLGYPVERWTGDPTFWRDHIHPEDRDWTIDSFLTATRERRAHEFEYRMIAADGRIVWLRDMVTVVVERDELVSLRGVMVDVSAMKQAKQELETSEQQQALVLASLPMALYRSDLRDAFGMTWIGEEILRITGFGPDRFMADPLFWESRIHPDDRERVLDLFSRTLQDGLAASEYRWRCADEEYRWFLDHNVLIRDAGGEPREIFGVCLNIHARKQAEESHRHAEERLLLMGRATHDAIWDWDLTKQSLWWSTGFQTIFGHTQDPLDASIDSWFSHVHPDDLERVSAGIRAAIESGTSSWAGEYRFRRGDGSYAHVYDRAFVVRDAAGKSVRMVGSMMDITERKRLEEQFRQSQKMEAVGLLAGGVAHDFNNLLTVITSYCHLLLDDLSPADPRRADLEEIRKAATGAAMLTRQLLAFSRQQVLEPKVLDLNAVVAAAGKLLKRLIGEDVELAAVLAPDLGTIKADLGQLEQVIMNLAVNARDAMPLGGKLTIETGNVELDGAYTQEHPVVTAGPYVLLSVSDSGIGMDEATQSRIFEPFFTTKEKGKGTGLGLSTVYGIVKQSGGFVWVYSELGHGTTFKIYLPRVDERADAEAGAEAGPSSMHGAETVLVAEDAAAVRAVVRQVLKRHGYVVLTAADGQSALELALEQEGPIHLLVTDVIMPEMSGPQLADRLRERRPELKVLFVSGYTDDAIVRHGILEPGIAFLQKPFTPEALARKVREVLDKPA